MQRQGDTGEQGCCVLPLLLDAALALVPPCSSRASLFHSQLASPPHTLITSSPPLPMNRQKSSIASKESPHTLSTLHNILVLDPSPHSPAPQTSEHILAIITTTTGTPSSPSPAPAPSPTSPAPSPSPPAPSPSPLPSSTPPRNHHTNLRRHRKTLTTLAHIGKKVYTHIAPLLVRCWSRPRMQALDDASCRTPNNVSSSSSSCCCCAEPLCLSNTNHNCCLHNQSQMHRHANRSPLTSPRLNHCHRLASTPAPAPAVDAAPSSKVTSISRSLDLPLPRCRRPRPVVVVVAAAATAVRTLS